MTQHSTRANGPLAWISLWERLGGRSRLAGLALVAALLLAIPALFDEGSTAQAQEGVTTRSGHGFIVSVSEPEGEDFPGDISTPGGAMVGDSVSGLLDGPYDVDSYRTLLERGKVYELVFERGDISLGTDVYIRDRKGNGYLRFYRYLDIIHEELVGRSMHVAEYDGFHFIEISNWAEQTPTPYTFTLRDVTHLWQPPPDMGPRRLEINQSWLTGETITGIIDWRLDEDVFAMELEKGGLYQIDLRGESSGSGTLENPRIGGVSDPGRRAAAEHPRLGWR